MTRQWLIWTAIVLMGASSLHGQNRRDLQVLQDQQDIGADKSWVYDDLETAILFAKEEQKPLMVVFR